MGGCMENISQLDVEFDKCGYTNAGAHKPINIWWKATVIEVTDLGIYRGERYEGRDSILTVGFIQLTGTMQRVVIDTITLSAPGKEKMPVSLLLSPTELTFVEKSFPLFDAQAPKDGRDVQRDYAEVELKVDLAPNRRPYHLHMKGRYIDREGRNAPINVEETIKVRRMRQVERLGSGC